MCVYVCVSSEIFAAMWILIFAYFTSGFWQSICGCYCGTFRTATIHQDDLIHIAFFTLAHIKGIAKNAGLVL